MKKAIATLGCLALSSAANAVVITEDDTNIYEAGQVHSNTVNLNNSYDNVYLDILAKGDFGKYRDEKLSFSIDNIELANWSYNTPDIDVTVLNSVGDYILEGTIAISHSDWTQFTADNVLNISWATDETVTPLNPIDRNYVSYTLRGDLVTVSEPSSLALFGLGLGLMGWRLRKSA